MLVRLLTDVRRGKLAFYESWGFPEAWVEVPEVQTPGRPQGLVRGLTICRLDGGRFRTAAESGAFPGWRASEIHAALNELEVSDRTSSALPRAGRTRSQADPDVPAVMAHCRLAIIGPENGTQPLQGDGELLVANGEIYNHAELRAILGESVFETDSDSLIEFAQSIPAPFKMKVGDEGTRETTEKWVFRKACEDLLSPGGRVAQEGPVRRGQRHGSCP